ncbi:MAG: ROK family protein [Kouleothrix sp.]
MLEQRLSLPVVIENDVNTLTMAEQWFGAGVGMTDFLVITLGAASAWAWCSMATCTVAAAAAAASLAISRWHPMGALRLRQARLPQALVSDPAILRLEQRLWPHKYGPGGGAGAPGRYDRAWHFRGSQGARWAWPWPTHGEYLQPAAAGDRRQARARSIYCRSRCKRPCAHTASTASSAICAWWSNHGATTPGRAVRPA